MKTPFPRSALFDFAFTVSEGKTGLRQSGIAIRVGGKMVAKPAMFGPEADEELPTKLLKKLYGELDADGLADSVTGDFGDIIETRAFAAVSGWASVHLKRALSQVFGNEVQLARARLAQQVARRLAELPEQKRSFAEQRVERVLTTMFGEIQDRIETIVAVALDAIEFDTYYAVVEAVNDAKVEDVATFAAALGDFGLVDMSHIAEQARRRLQFLDRLDDLIGNPQTKESDLHTALEHSLWVFGAEYALLSSNRTLATVIEKFTASRYSRKRAANRPDLLLLAGVTGRRVLIEFKRPDLDITREHEAQASAYRDELITTFPEGIHVVLIGRGWSLRSDRTNVPASLTVTSYASVVARARAELKWLLDELIR